MLAHRGLDVLGIDPNEDMLAEARGAGGGAEYRRGDAEATGLDDVSVALVTVAQAFHWLDLDAALGELHRILGPDGHAAALWNIRGEGAFMAAYLAKKEYGFLIPACILLGLGAGSIGANSFFDFGDSRQLGLGFGFVAIFLIALLYERKSHWWPLIPGAALILLGLDRTTLYRRLG